MSSGQHLLIIALLPVLLTNEQWTTLASYCPITCLVDLMSSGQHLLVIALLPVLLTSSAVDNSC